EVIRKYETFGSRVSLYYVDILRTPTFAAGYSELNLRPNQILIESPQTGRRKVVEFVDLFNIQTSQYGESSVRSSKAEQVMTSALLNVTSDEQVRVSVLGGYNQGDLSAFLELLEMNNYVITHENLATIPELDPQTDIALLVTPARDISETDLRKLDAFLLNDHVYGKTLFYISGAHQTPVSQMPNLSAWLSEWGIAVHDSVLFEMDFNYRFSLDDPFIAFVDYSMSESALPFSQSVREQNLYAASFYSNPLSTLFDERSSRAVHPLLFTSPQSGILGDDPAAQPEITGPHPVLILSSETRYQSFDAMRSHVLVSGAVSSFDPAVLGQVNFANSEYFLGLLDMLAGRENTVRIQDKTFSIDTIQTTLAQANAISIAAMIILPVSLLASGIAVWLRRRHR
ncbi:MAG: GldG family protein, partial [Oscillospiraceae bacterium]|nr:GldG family protein [Oscillospiraceae bacterium]